MQPKEPKTTSNCFYFSPGQAIKSSKTSNTLHELYSCYHASARLDFNKLNYRAHTLYVDSRPELLARRTVLHTYTAEVVLEMLLVGQYVQVRSIVIWLLDKSDLWRAMCTVAILVTFATPKWTELS